MARARSDRGCCVHARIDRVDAGRNHFAKPSIGPSYAAPSAAGHSVKTQSQNGPLTAQWEFVLNNWRESLRTIQTRFESLHRADADLYAMQRSWPRAEAQQLDDFLMSRRQFRDIEFGRFCPLPHQISWLLPSYCQHLSVAAAYIYRNESRMESILLYGQVDSWRRFDQTARELLHLITRTVRGYPWPFGSKPSFIDISTWPRLIFDACVRGQLPYSISRFFERDDKAEDGFFQTKGVPLVSLSAQAINPFILAVDHAIDPGPPKHNWPTGIVQLGDNIGFDSRLIWEPLSKCKIAD